MPKKNAQYLILGVLTSGILLVIFILASIQTANAQDNSSSNTNPNCVYRLDTGLIDAIGTCPFQGIPTVLSQVKGKFELSLDYMVQDDEKIYRMMVLGPQQCGACYDVDITKSCSYDSNGEFIPHLSDAQKAVVLDLKNNFSITVCPFTGKPNVIPVPTIKTNTTIGPSGSVNVTELGENKIQPNLTNSPIHKSNIAKSISNQTLTNKTIPISKTIFSPLRQFESGIPIQEIKCKMDYVLVIKTSNGHPSCVRPSSEERLLTHGWIIPEQFVTAHFLNNVTTPQNENKTTTNNSTVNQNQTHYPVYQVQRAGTVKVSDLPPISEIPPPPAVSTAPLTPVTEPVAINYSNPDATKILSVGMSPNPLKVGDIPRFTVTYQNISGKPLYGFGGCGWDLSKVVSSTNVKTTLKPDLPSCPQGSDVIESNQTITEEAGSYYYYKIIQPGLIHVTLTLELSNSPHYHLDNIDTIQFNVTATQ